MDTMTTEEATLKTSYNVSMLLNGVHTRTFLNNDAKGPCAHRVAHARAQAFIDDGRHVPFLYVWLPKVGTLAARGDCLVPCTLAGDTDIPREKEGDDRRNLGSKEQNSHVCRKRHQVHREHKRDAGNVQVDTLNGNLTPRKVSSERSEALCERRVT